MSRSYLINYIRNNDLLAQASPSVQKVFNLLEDKNTHIIKALREIESSLKDLSGNKIHAQYIPELKKNLTISSIQRLQKVYKTLKYTTFKRYLSFSIDSNAERDEGFDYIERIIHEGNRDKLFSVKFNP